LSDGDLTCKNYQVVIRTFCVVCNLTELVKIIFIKITFDTMFSFFMWVGKIVTSWRPLCN